MTQPGTDGARTNTPNPDQVWGAILGNDVEGGMLLQALALFFLINPETLSEGLARIAREEAIGCMLDPTAYLDGRRFGNIADYREVLLKAQALRKALDQTVENAVKREERRTSFVVRDGALEPHLRQRGVL